MTQDALDRAIQTDRRLEAAAAKCRAEATTLDRRLREAARTNPGVLEQILDTRLIRHRDGSIARERDGQVTGYYYGGAIPFADHGLAYSIGRFTQLALRHCNVGR